MYEFINEVNYELDITDLKLIIDIPEMDIDNFSLSVNENEITTNDSMNFTIKCENISELELLQKKFNCDSKQIAYVKIAEYFQN
jgi:hypothetical protein